MMQCTQFYFKTMNDCLLHHISFFSKNKMYECPCTSHIFLIPKPCAMHQIKYHFYNLDKNNFLLWPYYLVWYKNFFCIPMMMKIIFWCSAYNYYFTCVCDCLLHYTPLKKLYEIASPMVLLQKVCSSLIFQTICFSKGMWFSNISYSLRGVLDDAQVIFWKAP
jgi:hypothetical protein